MRTARRRSISAAAFTVLALLASTSCGSSTPKSTPSENLTPEFSKTLEPLIAAKLKELRVPGAIILVDVPGQGEWSTGIGVSDEKKGRRIQPADHMRIGSVAKTLTATLILQLVDENKLHLGDAVSKYVPGVPNGDRITVRELLNMTSGLFNYTADHSWAKETDSNPSRVWSEKELLEFSFKRPPMPPGKKLDYSNTNYILLGMIAQKVTGAPLPKLYQERIFDKLGMDQSTMPTASDSAIPTPYSRGYDFVNLAQTNVADDKLAAGDKTSPVISVGPDQKPKDVTNDNPSWGGAAGAAISTSADMKIWVKALATGQLLSDATHKEQVAFNDSPYGLGIAQLAPGIIGHNGAIPGFKSFVSYQPSTGRTVVVLANLQIAPNVPYSASRTADEVGAAIWKELSAM